MAAYIVGNMNITDPETYGKYAQAVGPILGAHGAKVLVAGPVGEVVEGEPLPVVVVIEFPTVEQAKAWHDSPEYQAIVGMRQSASTGWMTLSPEFVMPTG